MRSRFRLADLWPFLSLMLIATACPKRQDGLVFDDSAPVKEKSSKKGKSDKETALPAESSDSKGSSKKDSGKKDAGKSDSSSKKDSGKPASSSKKDAGKKDAGKKGKDSGKRQLMYGRVVDRNDQPLKRVTIQVTPGNTELISNKWGEYEIDGLHNEDGSRLELKRGQDYTISAWKPGYHETTQIFRFDGETQEVPTITLIEDSIKLEPMDSTPMIPTQSADENGGGAAGKSMENE